MRKRRVENIIDGSIVENAIQSSNSKQDFHCPRQELYRKKPEKEKKRLNEFDINKL